MSLSIPTTKLNELDHFILASIGSTRGNKATIFEIRDYIQTLWKHHNFTFKRTRLSIPSYTYFYQRLERLADTGYIIKQGKRVYKITPEHYDEIMSYLKGYLLLTYKVDLNVQRV
jgi:hypothetical protein